MATAQQQLYSPVPKIIDCKQGAIRRGPTSTSMARTVSRVAPISPSNSGIRTANCCSKRTLAMASRFWTPAARQVKFWFKVFNAENHYFVTWIELKNVGKLSRIERRLRSKNMLITHAITTQMKQSSNASEGWGSWRIVWVVDWLIRSVWKEKWNEYISTWRVCLFRKMNFFKFFR